MTGLATRICFVAFFVLLCASLVQADLNEGVVAAWTFDDGKVTDAIGQNHGKLFKGAVVKNGGKFGKALDVNGSDDCRADIKLSKDIEKVLLFLNTSSHLS